MTRPARSRHLAGTRRARSRRLLCRTVSLAALALAAAPVGGLLQPQTAGALAPSSVAYWVKLGATVPTVPKGGLLVGNDPTSALAPTAPPLAPGVTTPAPPPPPKGTPTVTGPTAVSTLKIDGVTAGADTTLTLKVAPGSLPPLPSTTTIVACPVHGSWTAPASGQGDISNAPAADCSTTSTGKVAGDNSSISWLLPSSFQDAPGSLSVEILPNPTGQPAPFSVAFAAPDTSALQPASGPPAAPPPPDTSSSPAGALAPSTTPEAFPAPVALPDYTSPAAPAAPAAPRVSPRQQVTLASPAAARLPAVGDDRGHRVMAVVALFAVALAWWWVGSRPVRTPKLLGALGAASSRLQVAPAPAPSPPRAAGVGRFARLHTGLPRRI
jgi:hypothetical protein